MSADDTVTAITRAPSARAALAIMATVGGAALAAVADLLHVEAGGHGAPWVRRACVTEARA